MYTNRSQGFTLIELLVVIAIIGVLSTVVLVSLNTARSKGNDAAIQSDFAAIQTQAEIYYGNTSNSYGSGSANGTAGACATANTLFVEPTITKAIAAAQKAASPNTAICVSSGTAYAIAIKLNAPTNTYWCVDSSGQGKSLASTTAPTLTGASCQ